MRHRQQVAAQSKTEEQTECKGEEDFLPKYEDETEDTDFFPKRQPGRFPNFQVRNRLQVSLKDLISERMGNLTWLILPHYNFLTFCGLSISLFFIASSLGRSLLKLCCSLSQGPHCSNEQV